MFTKLDQDTDRTVSYEEFENGMGRRFSSRSDETVKQKSDSLAEKDAASIVYKPRRLSPAKQKEVKEKI